MLGRKSSTDGAEDGRWPKIEANVCERPKILATKFLLLLVIGRVSLYSSFLVVRHETYGAKYESWKGEETKARSVKKNRPPYFGAVFLSVVRQIRQNRMFLTETKNTAAVFRSHPH
jgi:hypothetical protein